MKYIRHKGKTTFTFDSLWSYLFFHEESERKRHECNCSDCSRVFEGEMSIERKLGIVTGLSIVANLILLMALIVVVFFKI